MIIKLLFVIKLYAIQNAICQINELNVARRSLINLAPQNMQSNNILTGYAQNVPFSANNLLHTSNNFLAGNNVLSNIGISSILNNGGISNQHGGLQNILPVNNALNFQSIGFGNNVPLKKGIPNELLFDNIPVINANNVFNTENVPADISSYLPISTQESLPYNIITGNNLLNGIHTMTNAKTPSTDEMLPSKFYNAISETPSMADNYLSYKHMGQETNNNVGMNPNIIANNNQPVNNNIPINYLQRKDDAINNLFANDVSRNGRLSNVIAPNNMINIPYEYTIMGINNEISSSIATPNSIWQTNAEVATNNPIYNNYPIKDKPYSIVNKRVFNAVPIDDNTIIRANSGYSHNEDYGGNAGIYALINNELAKNNPQIVSAYVPAQNFDNAQIDSILNVPSSSSFETDGFTVPSWNTLQSDIKELSIFNGLPIARITETVTILDPEIINIYSMLN